MKCYKITLPCGRAFTCITDVAERHVALSIFTRFQAWPESVEAL